MFDSKKELLERIFLSKSRLLEVEEVRFRRGEVTGPADSKLADELAAFANSRGGVLVLGVSDRPREVVGIPLDRLDSVVGFVRHVCTQLIEPTLNPIGPLDVQVDRACRFVGRNMKVAAFKGLGRVDRPQFDMTAVFEAVVNAVAHRDYSIYGSKIRLRLFADRLEIYSPGEIPNTLEPENLLHIQSSRNEVVSSLLAKCPVPTDVPWLATDRKTLMDKRGEGMRIIVGEQY